MIKSTSSHNYKVLFAYTLHQIMSEVSSRDRNNIEGIKNLKSYKLFCRLCANTLRSNKPNLKSKQMSDSETSVDSLPSSVDSHTPF